jgi:hypothetical protein
MGVFAPEELFTIEQLQPSLDRRGFKISSAALCETISGGGPIA